MKILHGNLHRGKVVDDLLEQTTMETKAELIIIGEQYENRDVSGWYTDTLVRQSFGSQTWELSRLYATVLVGDSFRVILPDEMPHFSEDEPKEVTSLMQSDKAP